MRRNFLLTPLAALLAVGASGVQASAQDLTSSVLTGTVTGPDGKGMPGVRIYLTSGALLTPREGRTDANGSFRFSLLPPGRYNVTYTAEGFVSRRAEMHLVAGVAANGSVRLRAMDVQGETVEISADIGNIVVADKTDTSVQTAFSTDRLEEIGGARGVAALTALTPGLYGAIAGDSTNQQTTFSIRGGLGRGNKVIQDGQMVNDALGGIYFNAGDTIEDLIESVAVIQSPLNAKLGNTDGGIVSITTKRGGNLFTGSLRYSGTRGNGQNNTANMWQAARVYYPDARGNAAAPSAPSNDIFNRNWQYSITGPIIPNYLTFALGGNITPTVSTANLWSSSSGTAWAQSAWSPSGWTMYPYLTSLGTFFLDNDPSSPGYGDVVRKSYWGDADSPDAIRYSRTHSGSNTFNLYLQATPNHQFSWYYNQGNIFQNYAGTLNENPLDNGMDMTSKSWNVSYKAVLGAAGIFDARYGKSSSFYDYRRRGRESVQVMTYRSYVTMDDYTRNLYYGTQSQIANLASGAYSAPTTGDGWLGSGIVDFAWIAAASTAFRPNNSFSSIGEDAGGSYGSTVDSLNFNYQHMLEFKGQHIIDVGYNMNAVDAPAIPTGARYRMSPVGQISYDIDAGHIGNYQTYLAGGSPAGGNGKRSPGYYAGKYIVFDTRTTTIGQLEPHALLRPNYGTNGTNGTMLQDGVIVRTDAQGNYLGLHEQLTGNLSIDQLPYMREYWGSDTGDMLTTTSSFYVNDMWTISDHHSLMLGVRADMFSLKDSARTVHSYTKLTPRSEYKFDLLGDQRHLFAASFAQFHQMPAANLFWPFIEKKWGNRSNRLWTGDKVDSSKKQVGYYLVDIDDLRNPENYTIEYQSELSGRLFGDVDKDFRPPTSTEFSVWYRRSFPSGGSFRIAFSNRTWSDLYDIFPSDVFAWDNPNTAQVEEQPRIKARLSNTTDYARSYNGVELLWDFPITKKIAFGGNYTFGRYLHNQTSVGSSADSIDGGSVTATGISVQTPWWFNQLFSTPVYSTADGTTVLWAPSGRDVWAPMQIQGNEFSVGYYLILNLTQGRARSNFSLRGNYTGNTTKYDSVNIDTGRAIIQNGPDHPLYPNLAYNTYPGTNVAQLASGTAAYFGQYTENGQFQNHLAYNLQMPLAKRLVWFINVNVANVFNHVPKDTKVPGGSVGANQGVALRPWRYQTSATAYNNSNWYPNTISGWPLPRNPFIDGWNMNIGSINNSSTGYYFYRENNNDSRRSITMSTGVRF